MKRARRRPISEAEFRNFKQTMAAAKASERLQRSPAAGPVVYRDALLRVLLVVEHNGELWLCPRRPGGWDHRQRLQMTDAAKAQRLRPARDITPAWLGIGGENDHTECPRTHADG
jgi:hypothetical protein